MNKHLSGLTIFGITLIVIGVINIIYFKNQLIGYTYTLIGSCFLGITLRELIKKLNK